MGAGAETPGEGQGTLSSGEAGAKLAKAASAGSGPLSDTARQQHVTTPLPLGERGGDLSDTARQHHGGLPASRVVVEVGTIRAGETPPTEPTGATDMWLIPEGAVVEIDRAGDVGIRVGSRSG